MTRYRITLTVHETGNMSKEDFRKLQEAVDTIATLADLKMEIDATVNNIATHLGFNPQPRRFSDPETYEQTKAKVEALLSKPMETGKHNPEFTDRFNSRYQEEEITEFKNLTSWPHNVTIKDIYGQ